jgi:hypothetical protein
MENLGDTDIINPWLSNGSNTFRTVDEIVSSAVTPDMTDGEKAFALWFQEIRYRHHSGGDNNELLDPVKVFNVYGYNTCGNDSICLATLWRKAGLKAVPAHALGHCISQAFYDGGWHFFDGDMHSVYLLRDNKTVAGEEDLVRDHDLIKRTHSKGILMSDTWWDGQGMCAMYFYDGPVKGQRGGTVDTSMNMVLRPGEAIVWSWEQPKTLKHHGASGVMPTYPTAIRNGLWEYQPDFSKATWRKGASTVQNITSSPEGITAETGKTGVLTWKMHSPYVFVGGRLGLDAVGARFSISSDGKTWQPVSTNLDAFFSAVGPARYDYQLKCELTGTARLRRLDIINNLQMAPMAMPDMGLGENQFTYSDESNGERKVRITHQWVERSASRPPPAPSTVLCPADAGEANGTDIVFQWSPSQSFDGAAISDYHFELSGRQDMRWPLSMDFYKLISRTADATKEKGKDGREGRTLAKAQYTLTQPGLLTPDRRYYWHVRAMNEKGVWGPWSQTWSFTPRGPACPLKVVLDFDSAKETGVLRWSANPIGRRPAKFRVYGSDEKGFTIADEPSQGTVGITKAEMAAWNPWFPANFITETLGTELPVIGPKVKFPTANKTYCRVVAVDEQGNRSGPSDYAVSPRPVIYSQPIAAGTVGVPYRYVVCINRSLGDLSARMKDNEQVSGYFDIERPRFALERGPAWMKIDEATGVLSGIPDTAGKDEIVIKATLQHETRNLDEKTLSWGNEKILSTGTEKVGEATQRFTVEVLQHEEKRL